MNQAFKKDIILEQQKAVIAFARGLETGVCEAPVGNATPLQARFTLLQELEPSNKVRCFLAREHNAVKESTVQLKVFSADVVEKESELLAFLLEAHAASELSHSHIAASTKPEQVGDIHFCVSEHPKDAMTLRSLLDCKGWLDIEESLEIARQIVDALQYAHQCETWHLKIQPECVWINKDNYVTLTDFGIPRSPSRQWAYQKRTQECSLPYRSPEQLGESHPDERSDLYGVGVLLYEMLTDLLPFNAQGERELRHKIAMKKAPPPHLIRPDIPERLSAIVDKLLLENPADRFQSAAQLQTALNQFPDARWQTINLQEEAIPRASEFEEAPGTLESEADILSCDFAQGYEPLSPGLDELDDVEADLTPTVLQPEEKVEDSASDADALNQLSVDSQAIGCEQGLMEVTKKASLPALAELPEYISSSVAERLKSWKLLPFTILALGVVLLAAATVLSFRADIKKLMNPSSESGQTEVQSAAPVVEKSELPNRDEQPQGVKDDSAPATRDRQTLQPPAAAPSDSGSPAPDTTFDEGSAAPASAQASSTNQSSTARALSSEVSKLRQQLRRINEAKAKNNNARKSHSIAKPRPTKSRKPFHRWRIW